MSLPIAGRWFERRRIDDSITLLWEPHVIELMRCNIWHVRGRDRDLIIDTGFGVSSLVDELEDILDRPVTAVATHGHDDHIGSHHEFDNCVAHPLEAALLRDPPLRSLSPLEAWGAETLQTLERQGYPMPSPYFVTALPEGVALEGFRHYPARVTRLVDEGSVIDTGDRHFEVLHLPGHSPGSIGLWEQATGTLFSGDAVYDGPLLDELPESDITQYCSTMERLIDLPVTVVHAGHDPSFGRERLQHLARAYLDRRSVRPPDQTSSDGR
ncbi:MAG: fold metallo-hydrolase [Ilumatobacteraceae bacterium]|nr:fold metallo-hydrolase [Ilumatobacteraceae bacterium]